MNRILNIEYEKFELDNGLEVTLFQKNELPLVSVNLWYKVGSSYETAGKTGFAHLFEHMMFQGSKNVAKEKHFQYVQEAGGSLNGSTNIDRTNYYETVPSNSLELALWLESDRMGFLLDALSEEKLSNQKEVVINERKQRYDNQPYGTAWEKMFSKLYPENHPYSWPTIGWLEDIESFQLDEVKDFFKKYYGPNNASLVISGDFEKSATKELVEKYFGEIKKGNGIEEPVFPNIKNTGSQSFQFEENVQLPRLYYGWHTTKFFSDDDARLDILSDILTGSKNARLYKRLVFEEQIVQDIFSFQYSGFRDGSFLMMATIKSEDYVEKVNQIIFEEIEKIKEDGVTENELQRSINAYKSSFIYSLQNLENMSNQINNYNCFLNEPNSFVTDIKRYQELSVNDIKLAAENYLNENYVKLKFIPKK